MDTAQSRLLLNVLPHVRPLPNGCGATVEGMGAADILDAMETEETYGGGAVRGILVDGLREHGMLWMRGSRRAGKRSLSPSQLRAMYELLHKARFPKYEFAEMKEDEGAVDGDNAADAAFKSKDGNISRTKIPGFPEMTLLGYNLNVEDFHGLSGRLEPVAWWEKDGGEFHHDGAFSAKSRQVPALVCMYCEEAPEANGNMHGTTMRCWGEGESFYCPPGSTLFFRPGKALELASPELARRARRMHCVYTGTCATRCHCVCVCINDRWLSSSRRISNPRAAWCFR